MAAAAMEAEVEHDEEDMGAAMGGPTPIGALEVTVVSSCCKQ